jgi:hypothetical protein
VTRWDQQVWEEPEPALLLSHQVALLGLGFHGGFFMVSFIIINYGSTGA